MTEAKTGGHGLGMGARVEHLERGVAELQVGFGRLTTVVEQLGTNVNKVGQTVERIGERITRDARTPWGTLAGWASVVLTAVCLLGTLVWSDISTRIDGNSDELRERRDAYEGVAVMHALQERDEAVQTRIEERLRALEIGRKDTR